VIYLDNSENWEGHAPPPSPPPIPMSPSLSPSAPPPPMSPLDYHGPFEDWKLDVLSIFVIVFTVNKVVSYFYEIPKSIISCARD
jgi:hypothetical protein